MKRGLVSVFIILGVVLAISVTVFLMLGVPSPKDTRQSYDEPFNPSLVQFQSCLDTGAVQAIKTVALGGGYFEVPAPSMTILLMDYPLYWYQETAYVPTQQRVEQELAVAFDQIITMCAQDLKETSYYDVRLETGVSSASLSQGAVVFSTTSSITLSQDGQEAIQDQFSTTSFLPLLLLYGAVSEFSQEDASSLCLSCLDELSDKIKKIVELTDAAYEFSVDLQPVTDETMMFSFILNNTEERLQWNFGYDYE